tara:strand:- start:158 stop:481 length:324 start_codon:yes stop_codon:yes gene_type:complete
MSNEVTITSDNFISEVLDSEQPVVVDFWAEWCMPCRMIAPVLEDMAQDYAGKLKIAKLNVDHVSDVAQKYEVFSIPTLLLFKGGEVVGKQVGAVPRETIEGLIQGHV